MDRKGLPKRTAEKDEMDEKNAEKDKKGCQKGRRFDSPNNLL